MPTDTLGIPIEATVANEYLQQNAIPANDVVTMKLIPWHETLFN
jgi:hypothetical protein